MRTIGIVILGDFSLDLTDGLFSSKALSCDGHHFRLHQTKHEAISSLIDTLIQSHTVIIHCHYIVMTTYKCYYPPKQRNQTSFTYRIHGICSFTYTFSGCLTGKHRYIYQSHGSVIGYKHDEKTFQVPKNGGILTDVYIYIYTCIYMDTAYVRESPPLKQPKIRADSYLQIGYLNPLVRVFSNIGT